MLLKQATVVPLLVVVISADESHCNINVLFQYSIVSCCSIHHNGMLEKNFSFPICC